MTDLHRLKEELTATGVDFVEIKEKFTPGIKITANDKDLKITYGVTSLGIEAELPNGDCKKFLNISKSIELVKLFLKGGD